MNGSKKALFDTNVIIYASKKTIDINKLLGDYDFFYASIISYMEVYGYDFKDTAEREIIKALFTSLEVVDLHQDIADRVVIYRSSSGKKIKLPDAIILATARYLDADLVTADWDDFQGIDSNVNVVSLDSYQI